MVLLDIFNLYAGWFISISITWFFEGFVFYGGRGWVKGPLGKRLSSEKGFIAFIGSMIILAIGSDVLSRFLFSPLFSRIGIFSVSFSAWYLYLLYLGFSYHHYGRTKPIITLLGFVINLILLLIILNYKVIL